MVVTVLNYRRSWSPAPASCTDGQTEAQSGEGLCPGGTVSLGRVEPFWQGHQGQIQGLEGGKEAAEGGVRETGGREGVREEGGKPQLPTPHTPLQQGGRLREPETAVCSEKCLSH